MKGVLLGTGFLNAADQINVKVFILGFSPFFTDMVICSSVASRERKVRYKIL